MIEDLIKRLDHPTPWVVRGGPAAILAWAGSLREALNRAFELSREGNELTSIREPDDRTVIPVEQIWEFWQHLGMVDKQPTRIADRYVAKGFIVAGAIGLGTLSLSDIYKDLHLPNTGVPFLLSISSSTSSTSTMTVVERKP